MTITEDKTLVPPKSFCGISGDIYKFPTAPEANAFFLGWVSAGKKALRDGSWVLLDEEGGANRRLRVDPEFILVEVRWNMTAPDCMSMPRRFVWLRKECDLKSETVKNAVCKELDPQKPGLAFAVLGLKSVDEDYGMPGDY